MWQMSVLGDLIERAMLLEDVGEAVNEMKSGKAPWLDGFQVECLIIYIYIFFKGEFY